MILTIVFSNGCDLDCSYCCIGSKNESPVLSVDKAIDFIKKYYIPNEENVIEFYGGEPTLHWEEIKTTISILDSIEDLNPYYRLYTNGVFEKESDESISEGMSLIDEILISVDGHTPYLNRQRFNEHTFNRIINNINNNANSSNIGISSVLFGKEKYDNIFDSYLFFKNMGVKYFSYEPLTVYNQDAVAVIPLDYFRKFSKGIFSIIIDMIKSGGEYELFVAKELLSSSWYKVDSCKTCSSICRAISPRGNIYMCRDHAANEEEMFYSAKVINFHKKNNLTEKDGNFDHIAKHEGIFTPCVVKDFQYISGGKEKYLYWLDPNFQYYIIKPMFDAIISMNSGKNLDSLLSTCENYYDAIDSIYDMFSLSQDQCAISFAGDPTYYED